MPTCKIIMYSSPFLLLLLLTASFSFTTALYYKDITPDTFDSLIDSSKASIMLELYAPWCGHCKSLAPEYEQLGQIFEGQPDIIIAQIDADKHKDLAKRFDVKGFPTLKWVQKGSEVDKAIDVDAGRTAQELLDYVNTKTGLSKKLKGATDSHVVELSEANFDTIVLDKGKYALVGFFASWCGHCKALKPIWEKLAALYADEPDVVVASVDCDANTALAEKYKVEGFPTLSFFGKGEIDAESYSGGRQLEDLVKFINDKSGLDIAPDGGIIPDSGTVYGIVDHIKSYVSASTKEERQKVMDTCQEAVNKLDSKAKENYKYYVKVFTNIGEKGVEYVKKEKDRLSKMLGSTSYLKPNQRRSFLRRLNVLKEFDEL